MHAKGKSDSEHRILLVQPPMVDGSCFYEIPLNLAYLAAALLKAGFDVTVVDMQVATTEELDRILDEDFRVAGVATYSYTIQASASLCKKVRSKNPDCWIVLGGAHASFSVAETFTVIPEADYIVRGEAEFRFLEMCKIANRGDVKRGDDLGVTGVICSKANRGALLSIPDVSRDVDVFPFASDAFHLFGLEASRKRNSLVPIIASRGCAHRCLYCSSPVFWQGVRIRSWRNLRSELEAYVRMGIDRVNFRDDDMASLVPLHKQLLPFLQNLGFQWGCELRLDRLRDGIIERFVEAGLVRARTAVETIHSHSLKRIRKNWGDCDIEERIRRVHKLVELCPEVRVSFMIGIPGEGEKEIRETMDFAERLRPATCAFWAYSPLPGTPIYQRPKAHGITILPHKQLDPLFSVIETPELSNSQINNLLAEAHRRFTDPTWVTRDNRANRV
jgi:radical SAM superfamily enzyme YgiQ (UPF0313 family)